MLSLIGEFSLRMLHCLVSRCLLFALPIPPWGYIIYPLGRRALLLEVNQFWLNLYCDPNSKNLG